MGWGKLTKQCGAHGGCYYPKAHVRAICCMCKCGSAKVQARGAYLPRTLSSARFQPMNLRTQHKHSEKSELPRAWAQQTCFGSRAKGGEGAESADLPWSAVRAGRSVNPLSYARDSKLETFIIFSVFLYVKVI